MMESLPRELIAEICLLYDIKTFISFACVNRRLRRWLMSGDDVIKQLLRKLVATWDEREAAYSHVYVSHMRSKRIVMTGLWAVLHTTYMNKMCSLNDHQMMMLMDGYRMEPMFIESLTEKAIGVLSKQPNMLKLSSPLYIVGDTRGSFDDLLQIFAIAGMPPNANFIFLGNYLGHGLYDVELFTLLLAFLVRYPDRVFLLRGPKESRSITQEYGFYDHCLARWGENGAKVWKLFTDTCDYLPLCAVINKQIFCVHGGMSPSIDNLDIIDAIDRVQEVTIDGPMTDLLWGQFDHRTGWGLCPAGAGYTFGTDVLTEWHKTNNLKCTILSSQPPHNEANSWLDDCPCVLQLWSAPSLQFGGKTGGIAFVDDEQHIHVTTFSAHQNQVNQDPSSGCHLWPFKV